MIKRYSIYFACLASIIIFIEGLLVRLTFQSIVLRTVIVFCIFYLLGNLLGVITIEALLESQVRKINKLRTGKDDQSET